MTGGASKNAYQDGPPKIAATWMAEPTEAISIARKIHPLLGVVICCPRFDARALASLGLQRAARQRQRGLTEDVAQA